MIKPDGELLKAMIEKLKKSEGEVFSESTSPFHKWLGPRIEKIEHGKVELTYPLREEMFNPMGTLHGGMIAAIVDDAAGVAVFSLEKDDFHSTLNNVVDYLAPVFPGDSLQVKAEALKTGKTTVHVQVDFYSFTSKKMVARGISNLIYLGALKKS